MQPPHFFHDQFGHIQSTAKVLNLGQLRTNLGSNKVEGLNTRAQKYEHSALTTQQPPTKIDCKKSYLRIGNQLKIVGFFIL